MEVLRKLELWMDPVVRPGPEAMAVDEWLLENVTAPLLRVYRWDGDWASVGYFGKINEARAAIPHVRWVRRWTGGGVVDHRANWTYSLVVPQAEPLANTRGAESYRWIHAALAKVLGGEGTTVELSEGTAETGAALCFENPVSYDLVGEAGHKIAGAGQRRTRLGLLHQGSAAMPCDETTSRQRAENLAKSLSECWQRVDFEIAPQVLKEKTTARYGNERWLEKR